MVHASPSLACPAWEPNFPVGQAVHTAFAASAWLLVVNRRRLPPEVVVAMAVVAEVVVAEVVVAAVVVAAVVVA